MPDRSAISFSDTRDAAQDKRRIASESDEMQSATSSDQTDVPDRAATRRDNSRWLHARNVALATQPGACKQQKTRG